ncbi:MAG: CBS domain-containing protein [Cyanobacteria bacterium J06626_18]
MLTVADIMTQTVRIVDRTHTVADAIVQMQTHELRSLIVERSSESMPYGILTEQDIVYKVMARGLDPARVRVQDVMRQTCIFLEPHLPLKEAALIMADSAVHRAPVVQDGELLGIVSVNDLVTKGYAMASALT